MESLKEAIKYLMDTGAENASPEIVEICGKTYCTKDLKRYDIGPEAYPIKANSLTALVDYIRNCHSEFPGKMIIHIESPKTVRLLSQLNGDRKREELFVCQANVSEFEFDHWYDQERFIIELQANFVSTPDLDLIKQVAGNVVANTTANYGDDGMAQKVTVTSGVASKEDVIVPNPCELIPYRTFQEVDQPVSSFVFRLGDKNGGAPTFKLIEAENNIWKCEAIKNIKNYLLDALDDMPDQVSAAVTIIG
jgi:hypothetical protein